MKFLVAFCCFGLIAVGFGAPSPDMEMLKPLVTQCQTEEGGSDSDFASMMKAQVPTSAAGHCMMTCVHEKAGIIKDGKINKPVFVEIGKMVVNNDEKLVPFVSEMADECESSISGKNRCEMGLAFGTCLRNTSDKKGIKVDFF